MDIGVQSYCYRGFKDNAKVAELVRESGLTKIELCGVHADFDDPSGFDAVIETYRAAGVDIVSIGVQGFRGDVARERNFFECARRAGATLITADFAVDSVPGSLESVAALSDEFGIKVGIHNHGGRHWLGPVQMLKHVFSIAPAAIGLCLDTAWALDSRENPVAMAETFADRLYGVHIKDFIFDRARQPKDVVAGEGNLALADLMARLKTQSFDGVPIIEYEGDVDNPVPAIQKSVAAIEAAS